MVGLDGNLRKFRDHLHGEYSLELHRLIFRLDFPKAFRIFSQWGEILSYLDSFGFWGELGEEMPQRAITALAKDQPGEKVNVLTVRLRDIDGVFEGHPISSPREFTDAFVSVNHILDLLEIKEFERIGARFFLLEPCKDFDEACKRYCSQVRPEYWSAIPGPPSDFSIISVHKDGDQVVRITTGPLKQDEYPSWFGAPKKIKHDASFLFDVDCFTRSFKADKFDLKKLVALYYEKAVSHAEAVLKVLLGEGKNGST